MIELDENGSNGKGNEFILTLDEELVNSIADLCDALHLTINEFIEKTMTWQFRILFDDMEEGEFTFFWGYFDFSRVKQEQPTMKENAKEKKQQEIRVHLSDGVTKATREASKCFHWTPEQFIADSVEIRMMNLMGSLRDGNLDDLHNYVDHVRMKDSMEDLY